VGWVSSRVGELLGERSFCLLGIESAIFKWLGWGSQIGVRNEKRGTMGGDCTMLCFDQLQECKKRGTGSVAGAKRREPRASDRYLHVTS